MLLRYSTGHSSLLCSGGWVGFAWSPTWMLGWGLKGKTVGIFGLGRIGSAVARKLKGFEFKRIIYTGRKPREEGE